MSRAAELNQFLMEIEKRAYRMTCLSVSDREEALDIVQDAMLMLAKKYADKPANEWKPLFYRILNNRITDAYRKQAVKRKLFGWLPTASEDEDAPVDPMERVADGDWANPDQRMALGAAGDALSEAVEALPNRQRQAFLMRVWEGLDVRDTARAMGCSEGSVKTHYSRAVHTLRSALEGHWGTA